MRLLVAILVSASLLLSGAAAKGLATAAGKAPAARATPARGKKPAIKRSVIAKDAFQRANACPSTGRTSGGCKGYVIDHVRPLACGGADAPENIQWQTVAAGKAKDKTERAGCGR
jgi:hypothetical protein